MLPQALLRRGVVLEWLTLSWNVIGVVVLAIIAIAARSVALAGFGLDSLIEIGASTVVLWELAGEPGERERRAMRIIGAAFIALGGYLAIQASLVLALAYHPRHSIAGIVWTALTAASMLALSRAKRATGKALGNPVLVTEAKVTAVDALLACAVLLGLVLNSAANLWWADPLAGYVILFYGLREGRAALAHH